jgi:hypothetical protein
VLGALCGDPDLAQEEAVRTNGEGKPVVALDLDGTLGDYHTHFLWFAEQWLGKLMPDAEAINPGMRLHKFMGVRLADYRACKLAYRQGGLKRFMPVYDGAGALSRQIRRAGAELWICTTRPYLRLDSIDPDTREWLRRAGIKYDAVLYGEGKYKELKRQAGSRVASIVDDLPELIAQAYGLFQPLAPIVRDQPYNRTAGIGGSWELINHARRAHDCDQIWAEVAMDIERWRHVG